MINDGMKADLQGKLKLSLANNPPHCPKVKPTKIHSAGP